MRLRRAKVYIQHDNSNAYTETKRVKQQISGIEWELLRW